MTLDELASEVAALRERVAALEGREEREAQRAEGERYSPAFLAFWADYTSPRRRNKPAAWREWRRLRLGEGDMPELVAHALAAFKLTRQWKEGYEPEPARWLKSEPWQDEPTSGPPSGLGDIADEWTPRGR